MKKTLLLAGTALAIMHSNNASALYVEINPYIGADYTRASFSYGKNGDKFIENDYNVFSGIAGIRTDQYVMLEAFLQRANRESYKTNNGKFTSSHLAVGADLLGYYPIHEDWEVIGGIGFGQYRFWHRQAGVKSRTDSGYGTRFTAGLQYNLNYDWSFRASYRYVSFTETNVNRANEFNIGFRYTFQTM